MGCTAHLVLALWLLCLSGLQVQAQQVCGGPRQLTLSPNPDLLPQPGVLLPGQTIEVCFSLQGYEDPAAINWFHGVAFDLADNWDVSSVIPTTLPGSCIGVGAWDWHELVIGAGGAYGPGFFYDGEPDGSPGNNYGDDDIFGSCFFHEWTFCFTMRVRPNATPGGSLALSALVLSDGESGSWAIGANGCQDTSIAPQLQHPLRVAPACALAVQALSPAAPTCVSPQSGSLILSLQGGVGPYRFALNGGVPQPETAPGVIALNQLVAGSGTLRVIDDGQVNCELQVPFTIPSPVHPTLLPAQVLVTPATCASDADGALDLQHPTATSWRIDGGAWQPLSAISGLATGTYNVQVQDAGGCESASLLVRIGARSDLSVLALTGPDFISVETLGTWVAQVQGQQPSVRWDMGDGTIYDGALAVQHAYAAEGVYVPTVTATDVWGCSVQASALPVVVQPAPRWAMANALTPNNDGLNDEWHFAHPQLLALHVFARNGEEVWTQRGPACSWRGQHQSGAALPQGVYVLVLHFGAGLPTRTHVVTLLR
jgi:hypothetical protein